MTRLATRSRTTFSLLYELYDNEAQYTQDLYDGVGLTEDVKKFCTTTPIRPS